MMPDTPPQPPARSGRPFRPERDRRGPTLALILCALAGAALAGCDDSPTSAPPDPARTRPEASPAPSAGGPVIAPIFEHGDGRGTMGRSDAPTVAFLTEEEALAIIVNELNRHGVEIAECRVTLPDIVISRRVERKERVGNTWETRIIEGEASPLEVDLYDGPRRIALEFVSVSDHDVLGGVRSPSAVQECDLKGVARRLGESVGASSADLCFAALYDPATPRKVDEQAAAGDHHEALRAARRAAIAESDRLLRAQVRDLLRWLEEHNAIDR